jgi:hypothetical protein
MADFFQNLRGIIGNLFQLGLGGPNLKNNAGAIEARNAGDSAFAIMRVASPAADNDVANKQYVDTMAGATIVTDQFNGNNPLPANTATEHFYVVTTSGANATIGELLWDDGTGIGTTVVLVATARMIATESALTGGTISLNANSLYIWDTTGLTWVNAGGSSISGALRIIKLTITNAASQDSAASIPANATVLSCMLDVVTPYSPGATISVGRNGSLSLLQSTTQNLATIAGQYVTEQDTSWGGSALPIRVTIAGAPAAGAGYCVVQYTVPDA